MGNAASVEAPALKELQVLSSAYLAFRPHLLYLGHSLLCFFLPTDPESSWAQNCSLSFQLPVTQIFRKFINLVWQRFLNMFVELEGCLWTQTCRPVPQEGQVLTEQGSLTRRQRMPRTSLAPKCVS